MIFKCEECGKEVERYPSQVHDIVFCSHKCRGDYYRRHMRADEKEKVLLELGIEYQADEHKIKLIKLGYRL